MLQIHQILVFLYRIGVENSKNMQWTDFLTYRNNILQHAIIIQKVNVINDTYISISQKSATEKKNSLYLKKKLLLNPEKKRVENFDQIKSPMKL